MRQISIGFLIASAVVLVTPAALGQATTQTDQSEEDWRRSQKKSGSEVFDPNANTSSTGSGLNLPALEPIDQLPEDSRRHLRKMRARVIAEMGFGDQGERPYEPSEAAKADPELAAQEEEVWEIILTDLKGSGAGSGAPGSGPNKVAVAGQGSGQEQSVMRGGSTQSAAEIMAQLKGLQTAGMGGGEAPQNAAGQGAAGSMGDAGRAKTAGSSGSAGQSNEQAASEDGDPTAQAQNDPGASGESDGTSDGDRTDGHGSNGQGDGEGQSQADGQAGDGSGQAEQAGASESPDSTRAMPPMSPLSLPPRQERDGASTGASTSASDYLRQADQAEDESDPKAESP